MFSFLKSLFSTRVLSLIIPEAILIFSSYILAAYWYGGVDPTVFLLYDNGLLEIAIVAAGVLAGLQLNKLYVQVGVRSKMLLLQQLSMALGVTFLLESLLSYLQTPGLVLAPMIMVIGSGLALAALLVWRLFYSAVLWKNLGAKRVLFYGTNAAALEASRSLAAHPEMGLSPAAYVDDPADLERVVSAVRPDRIVVGVAERRGGLPFRKLLDLQLRGMEIQRVGELYEMACERVCAAELLPSQLIFSDELEARRGAIALQAIYSNVLALAGLLLLAVPHRPEFIPVLMQQMPYYGQRHAVRPGILGWSQLNCDYGRQVRDAREALEYDLYYNLDHARCLTRNTRLRRDAIWGP
jgi:Bacterial sugar transferase